jgi:hypothetical protein
MVQKFISLAQSITLARDCNTHFTKQAQVSLAPIFCIGSSDSVIFALKELESDTDGWRTLGNFTRRNAVTLRVVSAFDVPM